ncbi:MAG: SCO family protein [Pseudomonadota bacterium]
MTFRAPSSSSPAGWTRRRLLQAAAATGFGGVSWGAHAHAAAGAVVPPVAAPSLPVAPVRGSAAPLSSFLQGHHTAVQLMFTGCSAVCPIQGALFADVQRQLASAPPDWRLLSVSIDALSDGPAQLRAWLARFGAQDARWRAAVPAVNGVDPLFDFLQGRASGLDRHTSQVFVFDRQAQLVFRTVDLPSAQEVLSALQWAARRRPPG